MNSEKIHFTLSLFSENTNKAKLLFTNNFKSKIKIDEKLTYIAENLKVILHCAASKLHFDAQDSIQRLWSKEKQAALLLESFSSQAYFNEVSKRLAQMLLPLSKPVRLLGLSVSKLWAQEKIYQSKRLLN